MADSLELICRSSCELIDVQGAAIATVSDGTLHVSAAHGASAPFTGRALRTDGTLAGRTVAAGQIQIIDSLALEPDLAQPGDQPQGPALGVPITSDRGPIGALVLTRNADEAPFNNSDVAIAEGLAEQAALGLELRRGREDSERLLLIGDRERIARDLHDLVIQRLFATGMTLQSLVNLSDDDRVTERLGRTVDDLDATIREIRSAIFALEPPVHATGGLRSKVVGIARRAADHLGFEPAVRFDGPVDAAVSEEIGAHVLAVVNEGLSNVARHAHATCVDLDLITATDLRLTIADDGVGLGEPDRESGLSNLRDRAEALGGTLSIRPAGGGTCLEWCVPLSTEQNQRTSAT